MIIRKTWTCPRCGAVNDARSDLVCPRCSGPPSEVARSNRQERRQLTALARRRARLRELSHKVVLAAMVAIPLPPPRPLPPPPSPVDRPEPSAFAQNALPRPSQAGAATQARPIWENPAPGLP